MNTGGVMRIESTGLCLRGPSYQKLNGFARIGRAGNLARVSVSKRDYPAKKQKKKEEGEAEPAVEFDEAEREAEVPSFLDLEWARKLTPPSRHYECIFLIHDSHYEDVPQIIQNVTDKIAEFKGTLWRLNDWGIRRMAYKIKRTKKANYVLMNFEILASQLREFEDFLLADERIIRHLVVKMKGPETEDCPPPPEWGKPEEEDEEVVEPGSKSLESSRVTNKEALG